MRATRLWPLFGLGMTLISAAMLLGQAGRTPMTEQSRFVGTWRIAKASGDGNEMPDNMRELARLTFTSDGRALLTVAGEGKDVGQYKLGKAGEMELGLGDRPDKGLSPCIYKLEGDNQLWVCFSDSVMDAERPTEFTGEKGSGQVLFVLERAKAGEEKPTAQELAKHKEFIEKIRERPSQTHSADNLSQIGRAIYFYYEAHKHLPLHAIYSSDGKTPLLSWRVALLPFLDQESLYKEFKLDQPWGSPHNKKLIAKMPKIFATSEVDQPDVGLTHYQVFTGPETVFQGNKKLRFLDIGDGPANTVMVIEGNTPVPWTQPADLILPPGKDQVPAVGGVSKDSVNVLFCDAHVETLSKQVPPGVLRALVTPNGHERLNFEQWKK